MRCGLFGKLPAKRDYIALHAPRRFLEVWEPWMQAGISASRQQLGTTWQQSFLRAPIWRFWLGADLCGVSIAGALMPSLDGIGRYYPLTVFACSDSYTAIPPPELDAQDDWFTNIEEFLLSTLAADVPYEQIITALDGLQLPSSSKVVDSGDNVMLPTEGVAALVAPGRSFSEVFAALRAIDYVHAYAALTFWWTAGGEGYEPLALTGLRMPEPPFFAAMLTGRLDAGGDCNTSRLRLTDA